MWGPDHTEPHRYRCGRFKKTLAYEANSVVRSCEARKIHLANGKGVWLCTLRWKVENISTSKNPGKCDTRLKTWVCTRCNQRRTMVLLPTCLGEVGCLSQNFCCLFRYGCCFIACAQLTFFPIYLWFCGGGTAVTTRALYDACLMNLVSHHHQWRFDQTNSTTQYVMLHPWLVRR